MDDLIKKLKELKLEHPELIRRREHIVDAMEKRISIPSDVGDFYILNMVTPGILPDDKVKEIEEWFASDESRG